MNVLEQIDQANAAHTLHLKTMILNGVRDLLFGETASNISIGSSACDSFAFPLPPLAKTIAPSGSLKRKAKGGKRSAGELATLTASLGSYIANHPGLGIEAIGLALQISTKELALPIKKLLASKAISAKGNKRATRYFPKKAAS